MELSAPVAASAVPEVQARYPLTVSVAGDTQALLGLRSEWDALWAADPQADVFMSFDWFSLWWEHFARGEQRAALVANTGEEWVPLPGGEWALQVGVVRDVAHRAVAILPLVRVRGGFRDERGWILATPVNSHSLRTGVVAAQFDAAMARALASWLLQDERWNLLLLDGLCESSERFTLLREALAGHGLETASQGRWTHCFLSCEHGWQEMLEARPRRFRKHLNQGDRSMAQLGELSIHRHDDGLDGFKAFAAVEQHSWKAQDGEVLASDARLLAFYSDLFARPGTILRAECWVLNVGGQPAAAYLCLRDGRRIYTLKTSYNQAFAQSSRHSPSQVLLARLIEANWDRGVDRFDFVGNLPFVARWADQERTFSHLLLRRPRDPWGRRLQQMAGRLWRARSG